MRWSLLFLATALFAQQPKIDNVLVRMVPPGTTALAGAQIQSLLATPLYHKLINDQANQAFDRFTADTGFDPRRDVREVLFATTPDGSVLLARGKFTPKQKPFQQAALKKHGVYNIWTSNDSGLCILDDTLAAAGSIPALEAALDEWTKGPHTAAAPLLAHIKADPNAQLWAVSASVATLLSGSRFAGAGNGFDLGPILRGLTDTWLQASFNSGLKFEAHGSTGTPKDAQTLRDAAKGAIAFGRLSVPENQSDLLPVFDGITVEQQDRAISIHIDLAQNRVDQLLSLLNTRQRR